MGNKKSFGCNLEFHHKAGEVKKIEKGSVIPIANDLEINFDGVTGKVLK